MKEWKTFNDECIRCGSSPVDVYTSAKLPGYAYDGDQVECTECGLMGIVACDEDDEGNGIATVQWDDYEDEED